MIDSVFPRAPPIIIDVVALILVTECLSMFSRDWGNSGPGTEEPSCLMNQVVRPLKITFSILV